MFPSKGVKIPEREAHNSPLHTTKLWSHNFTSPHAIIQCRVLSLSHPMVMCVLTCLLPSEGFEPAIPTIRCPQTYTLDWPSTRIVTYYLHDCLNCVSPLFDASPIQNRTSVSNVIWRTKLISQVFLNVIAVLRYANTIHSGYAMHQQV
jgi:hypothetical protein